MPIIDYRVGNDLDLDAMIALYRSSTLSIYRPVDDRERMRSMLTHANLVITAWDADKLVGISRSMTDWSFATYLADLAVDKAYQKQGIGRELVRRTREAAKSASIFLFAAPRARKYYPHIGFEEGSGWILPSPTDKPATT